MRSVGDLLRWHAVGQWLTPVAQPGDEDPAGQSSYLAPARIGGAGWGETIFLLGHTTPDTSTDDPLPTAAGERDPRASRQLPDPGEA